MRVSVVFLFLIMLLPTYAGAGETGQTLIGVDVKQEPFIDAASAGSLSASTPVEVIKRQGGWLQIASTATQGWVKMTAVKLTGGTTSDGDNGLGALLNVAKSGRSGSTGVTVATGVRGLSPEDLRNASPNPQALKKLETFPKGKQEADAFAASGNLQSQKVTYLGEEPSAASGISSFFGGKK